MKPASLRTRVLLPLSLALLMLLGAFAVNVYRSQQEKLIGEMGQHLDAVKGLFDKRLELKSGQLEAVTEIIAGDPAIQAAWLSRDRESLLKRSTPYMENLRNQLGITHFYYHEPDRRNFLRVYNPKKHGDEITRFTIREAQRTGKSVSGIELGHLGTLTLRLVRPWVIDGQVVGFIEMGEEIDHLLRDTHEVLGLELYITIYKEFIDRDDWEKGMHLFGRTSHWNALPSVVVVTQTHKEIPEAFRSFMRRGRHPYMTMDKKLKLSLQGRQYRVGVIPLFDSPGRDVGDIVVLNDVTGALTRSRKTLFRSTAAAAVIALLLFLLFYRMLGRVDRELATRRRDLEEIVQERTRELTRMNLALREEITRREKIECALKDAQADLLKAQRVARMGNWDLDLKTGAFRLSEEANRLIGASPDDFPGTLEGFLKHLHPDERERFREGCERSLAGNVPLDQDHRMVMQGGSEKVMRVQAEVYPDDAGQPVRIVGTLQDITERHKLEQTARRSRNLESLGVLAGGLAHDFNNLLTVVMGNMELVRLDTKGNADIHLTLDQAGLACEKARNITNQLLTFAKGGGPIRETLAIPRVLTEAADLVLSGSNIEWKTDFAAELSLVEIDRQQMDQVFHNLLLNAKEAMPDGGVIMMRACNVVPADVGTPSVRITLSDEGQGIDEETLPKIFDPYFSTKRRGYQKGTGLGLSICHSVIRKHGGRIEVESSPGTGTTFSIYLPAAASKPDVPDDAAGAAGPTTAPQVAARTRILLMDDEAGILEVGSKVLVRMGHDVQTAPEGNRAVELFRREKEGGHPFDLVILDLTVRGGLGGREAFEKLRAIDPAVKAIVVSGYADHPILADYETYGFAGAVAKPFTADKLDEAIRQALDASS